MTMRELELKELLIKVKENNWAIPSVISAYELAKEMFAQIGSVDPVLRDQLILEMLWKLIEEDEIKQEEMKELLADALSEKHLFNGIGRECDDSVFNRTFTLLIIEAIIEANNRAESPFLTKEEVLHVHRRLIEYSKKEKDLRGYVREKGWAHSTAHTADALNSIVHAKEIGHQELLEIMELIRYKVCDSTCAYINNEEERLITTFINIRKRNCVSVSETIGWLNSFVGITTQEVYPDIEYLRQNRKQFFRSLAYRAKQLEFEEEILETLDQILKMHICR